MGSQSSCVAGSKRSTSSRLVGCPPRGPVSVCAMVGCPLGRAPPCRLARPGCNCPAARRGRDWVRRSTGGARGEPGWSGIPRSCNHRLGLDSRAGWCRRLRAWDDEAAVLLRRAPSWPCRGGAGRLGPDRSRRDGPGDGRWTQRGPCQHGRTEGDHEGDRSRGQCRSPGPSARRAASSVTEPRWSPSGLVASPDGLELQRLHLVVWGPSPNRDDQLEDKAVDHHALRRDVVGRSPVTAGSRRDVVPPSLASRHGDDRGRRAVLQAFCRAF